jgi:hypothetical protein
MNKNLNKIEMIEQISMAISEICSKFNVRFEGLQAFEDNGNLRARFTVNTHPDPIVDRQQAINLLKKTKIIDCDFMPSFVNNQTQKNVEIIRVNFDNSLLPFVVQEDGDQRYASIDEIKSLAWIQYP